MFYEYDVTVTAGTTKASPATTKMQLVTGIIHRIGVQFPPGCVGEVHVTIWRGGHQQWPTNPEQDFKADAHVVEFNEALKIEPPGEYWVIRAWAPDADYNHTITVRIGLLEEQQLFPLWDIYQTILLFLKLFKRREE